jgi:hypothetical protein
MKNLIKTVLALNIIHTTEEAITMLWKTDSSIQASAHLLHISPFALYWLGQIALYAFLLFVIFIPLKKSANFFYMIAGLLLLYEYQHLWAAMSAGHYVSGFYTGILLELFAIYYWITFIRSRLLN